jgi:hypothetical protein
LPERSENVGPITGGDLGPPRAKYRRGQLRDLPVPERGRRDLQLLGELPLRRREDVMAGEEVLDERGHRRDLDGTGDRVSAPESVDVGDLRVQPGVRGRASLEPSLAPAIPLLVAVADAPTRYSALGVGWRGLS